MVREAYRLDDGIATFATGLYATFVYEDPKLLEKTKAVADLAASWPGALPVRLNLCYANGTQVKIELEGGVNPTAEFFSAFGRLLPKDSWGLDVKNDVFAEPQPQFPRRG
jgi:hypothetical protein